MILPLYFYDDPMLRKKAQPIVEINEEIRQLAQDLVDSMVHYNGVGLAGPQVGKLLRIFAIREEWIDSDGRYQLGAPEVLINPQLSNPSEEIVLMPEGCISIPGVHNDVFRPATIHVRYQKIDGTFVEEDLREFRARVVMHENDHLNGVLYIDRLTQDRRRKIDPHLRAIKEKYRSRSGKVQS